MDSSDSHVVVNLWDFGLAFVSNVGLVGLVKQDLLGDGTELELLETNNSLKFVLERFERFCRLQLLLTTKKPFFQGYSCSLSRKARRDIMLESF
jgi:hypothetical protein